MRPKNLAKDTTGMAEVLVHAVLQLNSLGYDFDVFVNRDCTVPFIRDSDIASSIKLLKKVIAMQFMVFMFNTLILILT